LDPFDRFLRSSLDETLVAQGTLPRAKADELVSSAAQAGEPFATALLDASIVTPWDLARLIALHYQMPVQPLAGYQFDKDIFTGLRGDMLHRHRVVPLSSFGRTRTFAVLEPPNRLMLDDLQEACGPSLFFFVAEAPEIDRVLSERTKVVDATSDTSWHKLFDSAEEEVTRALKDGPVPPTV